MNGNTILPYDPAEPVELECDVLLPAWRHGCVTPDKAREDLDRPLKGSTVRTVLCLLEAKGDLAHSAAIAPSSTVLARRRPGQSSASWTGSAKTRSKRCSSIWSVPRCSTAPDSSAWLAASSLQKVVPSAKKEAL